MDECNYIYKKDKYIQTKNMYACCKYCNKPIKKDLSLLKYSFYTNIIEKAFYQKY